MRKILFLMVLFLCIAFCSIWVYAEDAILSDCLTYMNGSWYYLDESNPIDPQILIRDAKTGEESVFCEKCSKDSKGEFFNISGLTNDGQSLIAIDIYQKTVLRIEANRMEKLFSFSEDFPHYGRANLAVCENYLFVKMEETQDFFRLDMRNGAVKRLFVQRVIHILAMSDGNLLVHQGLGTDAPERLLVIHPESCEELNVLVDFEENSRAIVAIEEDSNRIYAAFNAGIWILKQNIWEKVRNLQLSNSTVPWIRKAQCANSVFYLYDQGDISGYWRAINLNEDIDLIPVTVGGAFTTGELDMSYMREYSNQVIIKNPTLKKISAFELYTRLLAKDDSNDIYALEFTDGIKKLMEQGHFPPLSGKDFEDYRNSLYAPIAESLTVNQTLFGVLDNTFLFRFLMKPNQGVDVPKSMEELAELLEFWDEHPANHGQPLIVINGDDTVNQEDLLLLCLYQVIYQHLRGHVLWEEQKIITLLEKIRDLKMPPKQTLSVEMAENTVMNFSTGASLLIDEMGWQPPLLLVENFPMIMPMESSILLLNPYAQHPKEAMEYLSYLCRNPTVQNQGMFFHTLEPKLQDEPVEELEVLEKQKEQAISKAEQQQLEAEIETIRNNPYNYTASPKTLAMYREKIVPQLLIPIPQLLSQNSSISMRDSLEIQVKSYVNRQISTEQLLIGIRDWIESSQKEEW